MKVLTVCYHRGLASEVTVKCALEDGVPVGEGELNAHILKKVGSLGPKREGHGNMFTANSRVHRLLTFDTRGLFSLSIAWEFLRMAP